jgi:spermidine synthase
VANGVDFIRKAEDKSYDIVFVDSTDPKAHAAPLFGKAFYKDVARVLKDDGLVVAQGESYFLNLEEHKEILKTAGENFSIAMPYRYEMISYPGTLYNFILASKKYHPTADINLQRADLMDGLKYYNSDIHIASFAKPTYIFKELLGIAKN